MSFDPARIVPSVRDLAAGLAMRRRSLSLVPLVRDAAELAEAVSSSDLRALAFDRASEAMAHPRPADTPALCLQPCATAIDCQAARFFGADGVVIGGEFEPLSKVARSMRMMPLAGAVDVESAICAEKTGARAIVARADADAIRAIAAALPKIVLVADWSAIEATTAALQSMLRSIRGHADAVVVPPLFHHQPFFPALVEELDP